MSALDASVAIWRAAREYDSGVSAFALRSTWGISAKGEIATGPGDGNGSQRKLTFGAKKYAAVSAGYALSSKQLAVFLPPTMSSCIRVFNVVLWD
jgi:hypothetical protein